MLYGSGSGHLKTVLVEVKRVYCLTMATLGHTEMSEAEETERVNPFNPIPAPGFDMETRLQFWLFDPQSAASCRKTG